MEIQILLILGLIFFIGYLDTSNAGHCDVKTSRVLAKILAIGFCYPDTLPALVMEHRELFRADGDAIKCGRALIRALQHEALSMPGSMQIREHAYSVAQRAGAPQFGPQIASSLENSAGRSAVLGLLLDGLFKSLPDIVNGNQRPYKNSLFYQSLKAEWSNQELVFSMMGGARFLEHIREMSVEMGEWFYFTLLSSLNN